MWSVHYKFWVEGFLNTVGKNLAKVKEGDIRIGANLVDGVLNIGKNVPKVKKGGIGIDEKLVEAVFKNFAKVKLAYVKIVLRVVLKNWQ